MKKTILVSMLISLLATFPVFAGTWQLDNNRWKWQKDDGSYAANEWLWIDDDYDGIAECYCFDQNSYLYMNTVTPDGYTVNGFGAYMEDGAVATKVTGQLPSWYYQQQTESLAGVYNLLGWQSASEDGADGADQGWMDLETDGTGNLCLGVNEPMYTLSWVEDGDELTVYINGEKYIGFWVPETEKLMIRIGENVYYFGKNQV